MVLLLALLAECATPPRGNFQQLEQAAQSAFQQRDFARAAQNMRQAICLAPTNARAYHELGLAEAASGNFAAADAALTRAKQLSPRDPGILLGHAQVQLSLDKPDLARLTLHEVASTGPQAGRLYALLGRAYIQHKQPDLAIAVLLRAKQAGQRDVETLLLLATLENSQGAYADAIQDARAVMESESTDAQKGAAAAIAGLAHKNQNLNDEAIRLLDQATRLVPTPTTFLALAEIFETGGKAPEAIQVLERGHAAMPESIKIGVALGRNLSGTDARRAADILSAALQKDPSDTEAWRWLAEARNSLGELAGATAALKEIARREPKYPLIDVMIAQSLLKEDRVTEALTMLDRAEETAPSDPDVYYLRGKIYAAQGRYQDAVAPLRRALELAPTAATSYYQLGIVYRALGRTAEASEQFDRFAFFKNGEQ